MCGTVSSCSQTWRRVCLVVVVCGTVSSCSQTWGRVCLVVVVVCVVLLAAVVRHGDVSVWWWWCVVLLAAVVRQTWRRVCLVVVVCGTVSSCSQTNMGTCRNWISIERFKLCLVSHLGGVFYAPVYLDLWNPVKIKIPCYGIGVLHAEVFIMELLYCMLKFLLWNLFIAC